MVIFGFVTTEDVVPCKFNEEKNQVFCNGSEVTSDFLKQFINEEMKFTSFECLDCSLQTLDAEIFNETELEILSVTNSQIEKIQSFDKLTHIKQVILPGNKLKSITDLSQPDTPVELLNLNKNQLEINLEDFKNMKDLKTLQLAYNKLAKLDGTPFPKSLKTLDLSNNELIRISDSVLAELDILESLNLSQNEKLILAPNVFKGLDKLLVLGLPNKMKLNNGVFNGLKSLPSLDLSGFNLTEIDPQLFSGLSSLEVLNLSNNRLYTLESGVFQSLENLNTLDLSYNEITMIYSHVFGSKVQKLFLQHNSITDLPINVFEGTSIQYLNISLNKFRNEFNTNILTSLPKLIELDLSGNEIMKANLESAVCLHNLEIKKILIHQNEFSCLKLEHLLNHFNNLQIDYTPEYPIYDKVNINGVTCYVSARHNETEWVRSLIENSSKNRENVCEEYLESTTMVNEVTTPVIMVPGYNYSGGEMLFLLFLTMFFFSWATMGILRLLRGPIIVEDPNNGRVISLPGQEKSVPIVENSFNGRVISIPTYREKF